MAQCASTLKAETGLYPDGMCGAHCVLCNTQCMTGRSDREAAGRWLRAQRIARGYSTVGSFARALGIDPSRVSSYETGRATVPDSRAEQIADVLQLDLITVRRHLGLWVPEDAPQQAPWAVELEEVRRLLHDLAERDPTRVRMARRLLEALLEEIESTDGST